MFQKSAACVVSRKGVDCIYSVNVDIVDYEVLARRVDESNIDPSAIYMAFYDELKKRGKVINCRYNLIRSELLPAVSNLMSKTGKKPDYYIFSNMETFNKVEEQFTMMGKTILSDNIEVYIFDNPPINKQFLILTYKNIEEIGLRLQYDTDTSEWILESPIYKDASYNDSHYNYYYGLKLHD